MTEKNDVIAFCEAILHGDEDHRAWLREAARNYVAGTPLPAVRGKGYTEAKIEQARQEARLEILLRDAEIRSLYNVLRRCQRIYSEALSRAKAKE